MSDAIYTQADWNAQAAEYDRLHLMHHERQSQLSAVIHEQDRTIIRLNRRIAELEAQARRDV